VRDPYRLGIVSAHRGHVRVEGVEGNGAVFVVWLPAPANEVKAPIDEVQR